MKSISTVTAVALLFALAGSTTGRPAPPDLPDDRPTVVVTGASVGGLYPGASRDMPVRLRNPYPFDIRVSRLTAEVVQSSRPSCPAVPDNLVAGPHQGRLPLTVTARESRAAGSFPIRMPAAVTDECAGATFTIRITGVATKVRT